MCFSSTTFSTQSRVTGLHFLSSITYYSEITFETPIKYNIVKRIHTPVVWLLLLIAVSLQNIMTDIVSECNFYVSCFVIPVSKLDANIKYRTMSITA